MILTASDVSSLAKSLSRWEIAEYVFAGLVTVACAGEYVADFKDWFTGGDKAKKERLAKASTLLLIGALALELTCLVKTNSLSGQLIGSLDQKAGEADAKANTALDTSATALTRSADAIIDSSTALSQAKDALAKAGKAAASLGKAENEANKAQTASLNALTLARGARQEADSFERDIVSTKKQAAEAESHLADAMKRATALTAQLDRLTTPRTIPHTPQVVSPLKTFKDAEYIFIGVCADSECLDLVASIDELLQLAGWKRAKSPPLRLGITQFRIHGDKDFAVDTSVSVGIGISVETPKGWESVKDIPVDQQAEHIRAAIALNQLLASNVSPPENTGKQVGIDTGTSTAVRIDVGRKPL